MLHISEDHRFMRRAIELALLAEHEGNLPVGAVIALGGEVVAEGRNAIWCPELDLARHAEMEAMRAVPDELWERSAEMTLYATLEPCLMCLGAILLHHVGRVVFGAADSYGGAGLTVGHLPPYFQKRFAKSQWLGPLMPDECDSLNARGIALAEARSGQGRGAR